MLTRIYSWSVTYYKYQYCMSIKTTSWCVVTIVIKRYYVWFLIFIILAIRKRIYRQINSSVALNRYQGNFLSVVGHWLQNDQVIPWLFKDADFVRNKINILIVTGNFDLLRMLEQIFAIVQKKSLNNSNIRIVGHE